MCCKTYTPRQRCCRKDVRLPDTIRSPNSIYGPPIPSITKPPHEDARNIMRPLPYRLDEGLEKSTVLGAPSTSEVRSITSMFGHNDPTPTKLHDTCYHRHLTGFDAMGQVRSAKGPGIARSRCTWHCGTVKYVPGSVRNPFRQCM